MSAKYKKDSNKRADGMELQFKVKIAYLIEPGGDMLIHWSEFQTLPTVGFVRNMVKKWKAKDHVHKLISVQRHKILFDNMYID